MSRIQAFQCGTPKEHCTGFQIKGESAKAHSERGQAFNCYAKFLINVKGYTQIGSRDFSPPPDENGNLGPVEVLTKKMRFGGRWRRGKENRHMRDRQQGVPF